MPAYTPPTTELTAEELAALREEMGAHWGELELHSEHND